MSRLEVGSHADVMGTPAGSRSKLATASELANSASPAGGTDMRITKMDLFDYVLQAYKAEALPDAAVEQVEAFSKYAKQFFKLPGMGLRSYSPLTSGLLITLRNGSQLTITIGPEVSEMDNGPSATVVVPNDQGRVNQNALPDGGILLHPAKKRH